MVQQGKSSDILSQLYGDTAHLKKILRPYLRKIASQYPNPHLEKLFLSLDSRIISIAPMVLCQSIMADLGKKAQGEDLAALALHMLAISTHDDVVDEMPKDRILVAALTYAGNIATNEGSKLLAKQKNNRVMAILLDTVNLNHFYQQHVAETLWRKPPNSFPDYRDGISHICVFISIGLLYGLALTDRMDLKNKIIKYSNGYGVALQLIDDLREIEEDKISGYWSYPMLEKEPFKKSFKQLFNHIDQARKTIPAKWVKLQSLLDRLEEFASSIQR